MYFSIKQNNLQRAFGRSNRLLVFWVGKDSSATPICNHKWLKEVSAWPNSDSGHPWYNKNNSRVSLVRLNTNNGVFGYDKNNITISLDHYFHITISLGNYFSRSSFLYITTSTSLFLHHYIYITFSTSVLDK